MGIFQDLVAIVNRAPWDLSIRFDGQDMTLVPGTNHVPAIVLPYALNQNPLMGSADVDNPNITGCEYLIGIVGKERKYPCDPLTIEQIAAQKNSPSRFDYLPLMENRLGPRDHVEVKGRKLPSSFEVKLQTTTEEFGETQLS